MSSEEKANKVESCIGDTTQATGELTQCDQVCFVFLSYFAMFSVACDTLLCLVFLKDVYYLAALL